MPKSVHDDVLDASLNYIKNNASKLVVCGTEPTTYAEANATYALADVAVDSTDFTVANGDTSGRKVTVAAQSGFLIDAAGTNTANWVCLLDTVNSKLLYKTSCTAQSLTGNGSNTVSTPAWDIEIADPS